MGNYPLFGSATVTYHLVFSECKKITLKPCDKPCKFQPIDSQHPALLIDGSLVFSAAHSWLQLRGASEFKHEPWQWVGPGANKKQHKIPTCLSKPPKTNRRSRKSKVHPTPPRPMLPKPKQWRAKKTKQQQPKWLMRKLYLINTFRAVGLWAVSRLIVCVQGRCRPQLCHTKTLGIFQLFSAAICPQLLPKKHKYRLWNERGICFSHPRRCHWGSGNGRLDFRC